MMKSKWLVSFIAAAILLLLMRLLFNFYDPLKFLRLWAFREANKDAFLHAIGYDDDYTKLLALQPDEEHNLSLGAAIMLVHPDWTHLRGKRQCFFNLSMDRLEQHWHASNPYPLILLTNRAWRAAEMAEISSRWSSLNISYVDVSAYFPEIEHYDMHIDNRTAKFGLHYRHMCAFLFYRFLTHPLLRQYKYLMRIDDDTCIENKVQVDLFQDMERSNSSYAYISMFIDRTYVLRGLSTFLGHYVNAHHLSWSNKALALQNHKLASDRQQMLAFATNWEIINTVRYRQADVLQFIQAVHKSLNIYQQRWGDAPLRLLLATLFWRKEEVRKICDFSYRHGDQAAFQQCNSSSNDDPIVKHELSWVLK